MPRFFVLFFLVLWAGCDRLEGPPPTPVPDSAAVVRPEFTPGPDTLVAPIRTAEPDSVAARDTLVSPSTVAPAPVQRTVPDTAVTAALDRLAARVAALAAAREETDRRMEARLDALDDALDDAVAARPDTLRAAAADTTAGRKRLADTTLEEAGDTIKFLGLRVFLALLVLVGTVFVIRALVFLLETFASRSAERRLFFKKLVPIARIVVWSVAIFIVLRGIFRLDAAGLAAAAAAVGVAVGFAAQDILKNIFGGLVIIFDQPFQVGDKISVGGTYGEVVSIGLRSTRIVTPDDNLVSVPNSQVTDGQVSNANAGALDCQVVTDIFLPGWVDESRAKRIAYEAAAASRYVFLGKPIVVLVKDVFDETFLTRVRVKAYVLDHKYEFLLQSDITERARMEFREQGLLKPEHGARAWVQFSGDGPGADVPPPDAEPAEEDKR